ncbi:TonB-dependent receptor plug domain-containing protein [Acetobacter oeni]|uniref:TonB-dependent receptor n=1 Tax=Acetobacter oeni TaxID=304077 RepID=A0A511XJX7_9PROT|nr:TonB-dependent receptor [Acetobacter oeni]MBB3883448.1 vitamin B12 transporter [Acetobacter oeni]NHO19418.1 TonB-dependent receptor [Acetobacter oeni]GBR04042.1 TonB-dependent ferrichrome siderophore receptor [Acetobacter oeni LMG 21952]GEN63228.1 TonB-dependent receptor [Acetobacter oeni]
MSVFRKLLIASTILPVMGLHEARADVSVQEAGIKKQSRQVVAQTGKLQAGKIQSGLSQGTKSKTTVIVGNTGLPEQISVSAARHPTSVDEIGTSMTIITEQQIQTQQRRALTDILERQVGMNVVQSGGPGATTSIIMRGTNANEVKVRLDGMDINDGSATNNAFDPAQFATDGMGRIEILRGPQSGLYGADAMAGVIDITTAQGQGRFTPFVRIEGGEYGTFNQVLGARGSAGRFHYNVELSHYRMDGFNSIPRYVERYYDADREQRRKNNRNDNRTANIRLGYDVTNNFDLGLTTRLIQSNYHTYSVYDLQSENEYGDSNVREQNNKNEAIVRGTAHLVSGGGFFDQVIGLGYMTTRNRWTETGTDYGSALNPDPDYYRSDRLKIDWHGTFNLKQYGSVLIGAEHFHDTFNTSHTSSASWDPGYNNSASMDTTAGYGQYQGNWNKILYGAANVRYDANSRYGNHVTWRVAPAIHVPGTGTIIKASAGSGFHGPSLYQLFAKQVGSGYAELGNPNLKAEKLIGYDAGIEQKLLHNHLNFGATWYDNRVKNLIDSTLAIDSSGNYIYSSANVAKARMYGVEAFLNWKALETLEFNLNYTWTHARDEESGAVLQRRPQHKFNFNTTWTPVRDLTFSGNILYTSGWRDLPVVGYETCSICAKGHGYFTIDIAANYKINRYVSVFARADNLLNRQYEQAIGYLQPGRSGYAGFTLTY